jgi:hypothetical protein
VLSFVVLELPKYLFPLIAILGALWPHTLDSIGVVGKVEKSLKSWLQAPTAEAVILRGHPLRCSVLAGFALAHFEVKRVWLRVWGDWTAERDCGDEACEVCEVEGRRKRGSTLEGTYAVLVIVSTMPIRVLMHPAPSRVLRSPPAECAPNSTVNEPILAAHPAS